MGLVRNDLDFTYGLVLKYLQKQIWRSVSMPKTELKTYITKRITCEWQDAVPGEKNHFGLIVFLFIFVPVSDVHVVLTSEIVSSVFNWEKNRIRRSLKLRSLYTTKTHTHTHYHKTRQNAKNVIFKAQKM